MKAGVGRVRCPCLGHDTTKMHSAVCCCSGMILVQTIAVKSIIHDVQLVDIAILRVALGFTRYTGGLLSQFEQRGFVMEVYRRPRLVL